MAARVRTDDILGFPVSIIETLHRRRNGREEVELLNCQGEPSLGELEALGCLFRDEFGRVLSGFSSLQPSVRRHCSCMLGNLVAVREGLREGSKNVMDH